MLTPWGPNDPMSTVVFFSPKGGSGKTTAALLLALGLAERGARVALIDADPNKPLVRWAALSGGRAEISVHAAPTPEDVAAAVREAQRGAPEWIILDTEGSQRSIMALAALPFDLALTPLSGSQLDLQEALKAAEMLRALGKRAGRPFRHFALLSRVPAAIKPRMLRGAVTQLRTAGVPILPTPLIEKEAFKALFAIGGGFDALEANGVWSVAAARENAVRYVVDVTEAVYGSAAVDQDAPRDGARG